MASRYSRARLAGAVVTAFFCGLLFASGFDLTRFGFAQDGKGGKVASSEVRSLAETGSAFEAIADHVTPSVVSIQTQRVRTAPPRVQAPGIDELFRNFEPRQPPREQAQEASGTGFIVSKDGYILTNNHVVADADRVTVTLLDKRVFEAKVIGRDPTTDVAVIKVNGSDLPVATLGDDNTARVGQWVVAIGNPLGLDFTVTAGIISAKGRPLQGLLNNRYQITDYIQTDAAINPGNSGGPLVNIRGEVVGINSAIASSTGYYAGYGFAIPVTLAKQVMDDLIAFGKIRRSVIGVAINNATAADAKAAGLDKVTGVLVEAYSYEPLNASPAKVAGLEPGDVIIAADGKPTDRVSTLQRIVRSHKPGETLTFEAMRFGAKKSFRVKLGEAPDAEVRVATAAGAPAGEGASAAGRRFDRIGVTVEPVSAELVTRARLVDPYAHGLMVSDVSVSGPAYRKLIPDGTILVEVLNPGPKRTLRTPADLEAVLGAQKPGALITFLVYDVGREGSTRAVTLQVGG
ncbi:MAG: trypsin-like peptidase domain-containing protein [Gemmatimonadaceae bacterium]|nr:trypsin-like peptidase domain-containing protein [Gemmatimonadaceae bacterium]